MVVGATADQPETGLAQHLRQARGVLHDLRLIIRERRFGRLLEADSLGRDDVHQRTALHTREHAAVQIFLEALLAEDHSSARPAQGLVRGRRHEVGVRHRARVHSSSDKTRNVGHVGHDEGSDTIGRRTDSSEIDDTRIRTRPDDDQLRLAIFGQAIEFVVIDPFIFLADTVRDDGIELTGKVERMTVRQVSAVREIHPEHDVARLEHCETN